MFSKLFKPELAKRVLQVPVRKMYLPPTQYDRPWPNRLRLTYVLRVYWETIPLFLVTCTSLSILAVSIAWACKNKVDVVYTKAGNISRTMDLRHPTVHKIILINQYYDPWPEMQDVLDKMQSAEQKLTEKKVCL